MDFADFILQHQADDPSALALSRSRYADFPEFALALSTLEARRKLRGKLPEWVDVPSLRFPLPLSAEQCSSSETAHYKAMVIWEEVCHLKPSSSTAPPKQVWAPPSYKTEGGYGFQMAHLLPDEITIADLTGGLGVDSWAFARAGFKVLYNDMRQELVEAARHNFAELGLQGVELRCAEVKPGGIDGILDGFKPDVFFLDPARRDSTGGKVFRIADCSPDVTVLLPELFARARYVLVKLSPMLDITQGARELGPCVKEIHVVGAEGECKELLFLLDREHSGDYTITVYDNGSTLSFSPAKERDAVVTWGSGQYLFVPGKALLKAGCFKLISQRYGLAKIGTNSHLYTADEPIDELKPFGKWFSILETCRLDKRGIRAVGTKYPRADVTARGVPMSSEELKKRLGVQSGSTGVHIFAAHCDAEGSNLLIVSSAVQSPPGTSL